MSKINQESTKSFHICDTVCKDELYKKISAEANDTFNINQLDKDLQDLIFKLMEPLLNKEFKEDKSIKIIEVNMRAKNDFKNLKDKGLASKELLKYLWKTNDINPYVELLQKYGLIWKLKDKFFVPELVKGSNFRLDKDPDIIFELHDVDQIPNLLQNVSEILYQNDSIYSIKSIDKNTIMFLISLKGTGAKIQLEQKGRYILMTLKLRNEDEDEDEEKEKKYLFEIVFNAINEVISDDAYSTAWILDPKFLEKEKEKEKEEKISKMFLCNFMEDLYKDEIVLIALDLGLSVNKSDTKKKICKMIDAELEKNNNDLYKFTDEMKNALERYNKNLNIDQTLDIIFKNNDLPLLQLVYVINPEKREYIRSNYYKPLLDHSALTPENINMINWLIEKGATVPTLGKILKKATNLSFIDWIANSTDINILTQKEFESLIKNPTGLRWIIKNLDLIKELQNKSFKIIKSWCKDLESYKKEELLKIVVESGLPAKKTNTKQELCKLIENEFDNQRYIDLYKITKEMPEALPRYMELDLSIFDNLDHDDDYQMNKILENIFNNNDLPLLQLIYILNPHIRKYINLNYYKGFKPNSVYYENIKRGIPSIDLSKRINIINWLIEQGAPAPTLDQALLSIDELGEADYSFIEWVNKEFGQGPWPAGATLASRMDISQKEINQSFDNYNKAKWLLKNNFSIDQEGFDNLSNEKIIEYFLNEKGMKFSPDVFEKIILTGSAYQLKQILKQGYRPSQTIIDRIYKRDFSESSVISKYEELKKYKLFPSTDLYNFGGYIQDYIKDMINQRKNK